MLGRFPAIFQYALIILHVGELPKFLGSGLLKYTHTDGSDSLFPWAVIYWCLKCKVGVSKWRMLILVVFSLNGAQVCEPGPIPLGAAEALVGFGVDWARLCKVRSTEMLSKTSPKASSCWLRANQASVSWEQASLVLCPIMREEVQTQNFLQLLGSSVSSHIQNLRACLSWADLCKSNNTWLRFLSNCRLWAIRFKNKTINS